MKTFFLMFFVTTKFGKKHNHGEKEFSEKIGEEKKLWKKIWL